MLVMILVLPMYAFLLFCVGGFTWTCFTPHSHMTAIGEAVAVIGARGSIPTQPAARLPWILQRIVLWSFVVVAIALGVLFIGLRTGSSAG